MKQLVFDDLKRIAGWKIGFSDHTVDEYAE